MSKKINTAPVAKFSDGEVAAAIWRNVGENGSFYTVDFTRSYKDTDGKYQTARNFSGTQILRHMRLASKAYDTIELLRAEDVTPTKASAA